MISLGLMTEDSRSRAQDALNTWREYGIATSDGKGRELPIADYTRAYAIQQFSNKFHNSLKERTDQLAAATRREDIVVSCCLPTSIIILLIFLLTDRHSEIGEQNWQRSGAHIRVIIAYLPS